MVCYSHVDRKLVGHETIFLLGDTFIRSTYILYDVDNLQVAMAQAKYDVDEEIVVAIPVGTGLPGAISTQ
jgi:hypothetical protein